MNDNDYKIVKEFDCRGKQMIIVKSGNSAHVMDYDEWKLIYGRNHQNRWKNNVDFNRYEYVDGRRRERVS